jgi:hypothetical protein
VFEIPNVPLGLFIKRRAGRSRYLSIDTWPLAGGLLLRAAGIVCAKPADPEPRGRDGE